MRLDKVSGMIQVSLCLSFGTWFMMIPKIPSLCKSLYKEASGYLDRIMYVTTWEKNKTNGCFESDFFSVCLVGCVQEKNPSFETKERAWHEPSYDCLKAKPILLM